MNLRVFSSHVSLGNNSAIGINASLTGSVVIGDNVMMGPYCSMYSRNHAFDRTDVRMCKQGYLPEEIRTNWRKRGRQSADWVDRLKPDWSKIFRDVKKALNDIDVQKYVDVKKVEGLMEKYKNLDSLNDNIIQNEVKLILIPLVFYRFLLQYREMIDNEEIVVNS